MSCRTSINLQWISEESSAPLSANVVKLISFNRLDLSRNLDLSLKKCLNRILSEIYWYDWLEEFVILIRQKALFNVRNNLWYSLVEICLQKWYLDLSRRLVYIIKKYENLVSYKNTDIWSAEIIVWTFWKK